MPPVEAGALRTDSAVFSKEQGEVYRKRIGGNHEELKDRKQNRPSSPTRGRSAYTEGGGKWGGRTRESDYFTDERRISEDSRISGNRGTVIAQSLLSSGRRRRGEDAGGWLLKTCNAASCKHSRTTLPRKAALTSRIVPHLSRASKRCSDRY